MGGSNAVDPQGGPKRRTRRNVNQNLGCVYCWATDAETGQPCTSRSAEGSNLPYCERHRRIGDGAIQVLDHPENHAVGKIVVANIDLPKGYKFVYWGKRCRWRGCKGEDRAMSFRPNGGVIDPTGCEGQQVQFMACPGPSERSNIKCTDVCFGKTYDTSLVGREIETSEPVKKNHQLLQWYGSKEWFESRGIPRTNVGTEAHPAPQRKKKLKSATEGGRKRKAKGQLKPEVGTSGQEHVKPEEDVMVQLTPKGLLVASDLLEVGGRPFEYSIHRLDRERRFAVSQAFPDLGSAEEVLAVPTFQCALGVDLNPEAGIPETLVQEEMNRLHMNIVMLESEVYSQLTARGFFCDSVDPLTGCSMHSRSGSRYSEVYSAHKLLGYQILEANGIRMIPMVVHPQFGTSGYPVTIFSTAPPDILHEVLQAATTQAALSVGSGSNLRTDELR